MDIVSIFNTPFQEQFFWGLVLKNAAATAKVHLFKNDIVPNPSTAIGDFTEADFDGYAAVTVTSWDNTHIDPVNSLPYISNLTQALFAQTGIVITNTVYGFYVEDGAGAALFAQRFDAPILMDAIGKQIELNMRIFFQGVTGPDASEV